VIPSKAAPSFGAPTNIGPARLPARAQCHGYVPSHGDLVLLLLLPVPHGGGGAERGAETGGELGLPETERGEGRLRSGGGGGGGDEASCPARAPGPAEQEAEEDRRPERPREERHLRGRPPRRGLLQHPRHRRQHVPHRNRPGRGSEGGGRGGACGREGKRRGQRGALRSMARIKDSFFLDFFLFVWFGVGGGGTRGARAGMMRPLRCGHGAWTIFFFGGRSDAMRACGPGASSVATWVGVGWPALQAPATRPRQAIRRGRGHRLQTSVQRRAATSARLAVADAGQVAAAEVDPVPAHAPLASGNSPFPIVTVAVS
jgi:hypothetical protein